MIGILSDKFSNQSNLSEVEVRLKEELRVGKQVLGFRSCGLGIHLSELLQCLEEELLLWIIGWAGAKKLSEPGVKSSSTDGWLAASS